MELGASIPAATSDGDFRDDGSKFQHVGPETANGREPCVTVRVLVVKR